MASIATDALPVFALFAPAFTPSTFSRAQRLAVAAILTTGRRTISRSRMSRKCGEQANSRYGMCRPALGAFTVNLVLYSAVEVWAWARDEEALVDRSRSLWDTEERRPSQADKRKALERLVLREEIRAAAGGRVESEEFSDWAIRLLDLAARL